MNEVESERQPVAQSLSQLFRVSVHEIEHTNVQYCVTLLKMFSRFRITAIIPTTVSVCAFCLIVVYHYDSRIISLRCMKSFSVTQQHTMFIRRYVLRDIDFIYMIIVVWVSGWTPFTLAVEALRKAVEILCTMEMLIFQSNLMFLARVCAAFSQPIQSGHIVYRRFCSNYFQ